VKLKHVELVMVSIENITQGEPVVATGLVPAAMGFKQGSYFPNGNTTLAQKYFNKDLLELELSLDNLPPLTLIYIAGDRNDAIAQAVQQQWEMVLGVKINLKAIERKVYFDKISKIDFELAAGSWIADYKDPMNFLEVFKYKTGGANNTGWENPRYTALLDLASSAVNPQERSLFLQDSEAVLMEEMPIIPVFLLHDALYAELTSQRCCIDKSGQY